MYLEKGIEMYLEKGIEYIIVFFNDFIEEKIKIKKFFNFY
jgi:hypothetical protein